LRYAERAMTTPTALLFVLAQAPAPQPVPPEQTRPGVPETGTPPVAPGTGSPFDEIVGITSVALLVALMLLAARKLFFKRRPEEPGRPTPPTVPPAKGKPELPAERPELRVELPPSEAELARLREAEELHARAEALTRQREETARAARTATDAAERKAGELGVDLSTVEGTGQGGRITVGDVEKAARQDG